MTGTKLLVSSAMISLSLSAYALTLECDFPAQSNDNYDFFARTITYNPGEGSGWTTTADSYTHKTSDGSSTVEIFRNSGKVQIRNKGDNGTSIWLGQCTKVDPTKNKF